MCDQKEQDIESADNFFNNDSFKSCFARSVAVNSQYKQSISGDSTPEIGQSFEKKDSFSQREQHLKVSQETPVRYRKNNRTANMDESRRFSCGSILSRRASMNSPKRNDIPVENIYNQNKIETLQWQLKEIEKSREMYKALMKEVVTFLEKAHVSLDHLGSRLNRKNSVPRSKSEHHIAPDCTNTTNQRSLIDEHFTSWTTTNKSERHPDEVPPEKLAQEAFRLLRTSQSLLSTQEPRLTSSENLNSSDELSDIEFLTQLAKEFRSDDQRPHRAMSFSLSPKLILPENDIKISTAFNRKLSLQLSEARRNAGGAGKFSRGESARTSVAESEAYSLPPSVDRHLQVDPLRVEETSSVGSRDKHVDKTPGSPATTSISSMEDESGFSSMNSFQDIGLPLVNSTGIEDVSARSVLLKSMLHHSEYTSLNDSEQNSSISETLKRSSYSERRYEKRTEQKLRDSKRNSTSENRRYSYASEEMSSIDDIKLWQKPAQVQVNIEDHSTGHSVKSVEKPQINHQRWHSTPEKQSSNSMKVLWV